MTESNTVFVNFDFNPSHKAINQALDADDIESAKSESGKVLEAQESIKEATKSVGGSIIFENGINLIINIPFDKELIEYMADTFKEVMGTMTNIGIGHTVIESHDSVVAIRGSSKGNIVIYSSAIKENQVANREFYKRASPYDLRISNIIKSALAELHIITTEEKVYDIFLQLTKSNNLNSVEDIQKYFYRELEELKENIRQVYKKQAVGGLMFAIAVQEQSFPGQSVVNRNPKQKSPHKRHNWWSIEEYNQDAVDYRKTDLQYVPGNVTTESQSMSMGGEPGESVATY